MSHFATILALTPLSFIQPDVEQASESTVSTVSVVESPPTPNIGKSTPKSTPVQVERFLLEETDALVELQRKIARLSGAISSAKDAGNAEEEERLRLQHKGAIASLMEVIKTCLPDNCPQSAVKEAKKLVLSDNKLKAHVSSKSRPTTPKAVSVSHNPSPTSSLRDPSSQKKEQHHNKSRVNKRSSIEQKNDKEANARDGKERSRGLASEARARGEERQHYTYPRHASGNKRMKDKESKKERCRGKQKHTCRGRGRSRKFGGYNPHRMDEDGEFCTRELFFLDAKAEATHV